MLVSATRPSSAHHLSRTLSVPSFPAHVRRTVFKHRSILHIAGTKLADTHRRWVRLENNKLLSGITLRGQLCEIDDGWYTPTEIPISCARTTPNSPRREDMPGCIRLIPKSQSCKYCNRLRYEATTSTGCSYSPRPHEASRQGSTVNQSVKLVHHKVDLLRNTGYSCFIRCPRNPGVSSIAATFLWASEVAPMTLRIPPPRVTALLRALTSSFGRKDWDYDPAHQDHGEVVYRRSRTAAFKRPTYLDLEGGRELRKSTVP